MSAPSFPGASRIPERKGFGHHDGQQGLAAVGKPGDAGDILADAQVIRGLNEDGAGFGVQHPGKGVRIHASARAVGNFLDPDPQVPDVGPDDAFVLGMQGRGDEDLGFVFQTGGHQHGLGRARGAFIQGGVGDIHPGELADQRLKLENGLERPLAHLRLVGSIGAEEFAPGTQAVDDRRNEVIVGSPAEEGQIIREGVHPPDLRKMPDELQLRHRSRKVERLAEPNGVREAAEQFIHRGDADRGHHFPAVFFTQRNITHRIIPLERLERGIRLRAPPGIFRNPRRSSGRRSRPCPRP